MSDGAAALILSSQAVADSKSILPLAKIVSWAQTGIDPLVMVNNNHVSNQLFELCLKI